MHAVAFAVGLCPLHVHVLLSVGEGEEGEVMRVAVVSGTQTHVAMVGYVLKAAVFQNSAREMKGLAAATEHRCAQQQQFSLRNSGPSY